MNAAAELENKDFATVAANFLARQPATAVGAARPRNQAGSTTSGASSSVPTSFA